MGCRPKCRARHSDWQRNYSTHVQPGGSLATPVIFPNRPRGMGARPKTGRKPAMTGAATTANSPTRLPSPNSRGQTFPTSKWETSPPKRAQRLLGLIGNRQIRQKTASRTFRNMRTGRSGRMQAAFFDRLLGATYMLISKNPSPKDGARTCALAVDRPHFAGAYDVTP
jgi:hypothetical protein